MRETTPDVTLMVSPPMGNLQTLHVRARHAQGGNARSWTLHHSTAAQGLAACPGTRQPAGVPRSVVLSQNLPAWSAAGFEHCPC